MSRIYCTPAPPQIHASLNRPCRTRVSNSATAESLNIGNFSFDGPHWLLNSSRNPCLGELPGLRLAPPWTRMPQSIWNSSPFPVGSIHSTDAPLSHAGPSPVGLE